MTAAKFISKARILAAINEMPSDELSMEEVRIQLSKLYQINHGPARLLITGGISRENLIKFLNKRRRKTGFPYDEFK